MVIGTKWGGGTEVINQKGSARLATFPKQESKVSYFL